MRDKILKLLKSSNWEDVLVGLTLAYSQLTDEEFLEIYNDTPIKCYVPGKYYFYKGKDLYAIDHMSIWKTNNPLTLHKELHRKELKFD
jgi:hypothetical protein